GRSVDSLAEDGPEIDIHKGDVFDHDSVAEATTGHDAVIVCLGSTGLRDRDTLSTGTANVVDAMVDRSVERLIVLSAAGVGESWRQIPRSSRLAFRTILRNVFADHQAQEQIVEASSLNWTIVRAAVLKDGPGIGACTPTNSGSVTRIDRVDVAAFLVDQLVDQTYCRQAISITG
ncbi:MAG: NAD(P)-dependent oxidoreductase, partial [Acidimicrobiales bacterium]